MSIFNKNSVKDLTSEPRHSKSFFRRIGRDYHVDWLFSVLFAFIVTVVLISIGILKYKTFDLVLEKETNSTKSEQKIVVDVKLLDTTIDRFSSRADLSEQLSKIYLGPADPSI